VGHRGFSSHFGAHTDQWVIPEDVNRPHQQQVTASGKPSLYGIRADRSEIQQPPHMR
jgi:hypothetical protein